MRGGALTGETNVPHAQIKIEKKNIQNVKSPCNTQELKSKKIASETQKQMCHMLKLKSTQNKRDIQNVKKRTRMNQKQKKIACNL